MDFKWTSSEDTFDRAVKTLQLSVLGQNTKNGLQVHSSEELSGCIPNEVKSNEKLYGKIFKEVMAIMEEEEHGGLQPIFSDRFNSNFSQLTYSQFVKDIHKASTQDLLMGNQNLLCEKNKKFLTIESQCPVLNCEAGQFKDNKMVNQLIANLAEDKNELAIPSCSKTNAFVQEINSNRCGPFMNNSSNEVIDVSKSSSDDIFSSKKINSDSNGSVKIMSSQKSVVHSKCISGSYNCCRRNCRCKGVHFKNRRNYSRNIKYKTINEILPFEICTFSFKRTSFSSHTHDKHLANANRVLPGDRKEIENSKNIGFVSIQNFFKPHEKTNDSNYSLEEKNKILNLEVRVVIDTPLIKQHTPFDILEKKLIEYYNKHMLQNLTSVIDSKNFVNKSRHFETSSSSRRVIIREQPINEMRKANSDNTLNSIYLENSKSVSNKDSTPIVREEPCAIGDNEGNCNAYNNCEEASQCIKIKNKFYNLTQGYPEVEIPATQDSSTFIRLMYDALQVGCVKSCGLVRDVVPSLQNGIREDAVQFYCDTCKISYSFKDVQDTFDSQCLTCSCPKNHAGLQKELVAEFYFKLLVEDLSKTLFTYLLISKEAEEFFGCTVRDFWHSSDVVRTVRRSIRNLLRSYKRKILSEFCLSTKNLFSSGPKYLININRETCIAPVK